MSESVALQLIRPDDRPLLERLWQLYRHDLSEFRCMVPDEEGRFTTGHLPTYFNDPDRCGYLLSEQGTDGLRVRLWVDGPTAADV